MGESYTITATPGANCYFVNWTGTAGTTNGPTLSFIMQSNTSLTATFITNIFIGMAGTYSTTDCSLPTRLASLRKPQA